MMATRRFNPSNYLKHGNYEDIQRAIMGADLDLDNDFRFRSDFGQNHVFKVYQADTSHNPTGFDIQNLGTGSALRVNQDGNGIAFDVDSEATTADIVNISAAVLTTGIVIDIPDLAAITSGTGLHIAATGVTQTSGNLIHVASASTALQNTGGMILSDHTAIMTDGALLNDFRSAATDETIITRIYASGALALGSALAISVAAMTTGKGINMPNLDALTSGDGITVTSASVALTSGELLNIDRAASGTIVAKTGNLVSVGDSTTHTLDADVTLDYDTVAFSRTHIRNTGDGDTHATTNTGSVLHLENVLTATSGTITDSVNVAELIQDAQSTGYSINIDHNADSHTINIDTEATTANVLNISATEMTTGFILSCTDAAFHTGGWVNFQNEYAADGLVDRDIPAFVHGTGNLWGGDDPFVTVMSRRELRTAGSTNDDYHLHRFQRRSEMDGEGGALITSGSVVLIQNAATETAGTLTDNVMVLQLVQSDESAGNVIDIDANGTGRAINITADNTTTDIVNIFATNLTQGIAIDIPDLDVLTTGTGLNIASGSEAIAAGELATIALTSSGSTITAKTGSLVSIASSRTELAAAATADNYDVLAVTRTNITNTSGTLTADGSVARFENVATQSAGTLTDNVDVLEIVQDAQSTGASVDIDHNGAANAITIVSGSDAATATLDITNEAGGFGIDVSRNLAAANTDSPLVYINDDGASDQPALSIHTDAVDEANARALFIDADLITTTQAVELTVDALASGFGVNLTSSSTSLDATGRILLVNHTGNATAAVGAIAEILSAATENTTIFKVTASAALAAGVALDLDLVSMTSGTAIDISNLAALDTGKALHIDATGTTQTTGILAHIDSAGTIITGAGRLLLVDHTAITTNSGTLSEFQSIANDETIVTQWTADSLTTGTVIALTADAITSGFGANLTSSSTGITGVGRVLMVDHTGAATATGTVAEVKTVGADETLLLQLTADAILTGTALDITTDAATQTTTKALNIDSTIADIDANKTGSHVTITASRTKASAGSGANSDDFDVMAISRTNAQSGGVFTAASGSVLNVANTITGTVGTDDAYLLEGLNTVPGQNTFKDIVMLGHATSHAAHATAGFGAGIVVHLENDAGTTEEHASIDFVTTSTADAAENTDMVFRIMQAGAVADKLTLDADGGFAFVGAGTFTVNDAVNTAVTDVLTLVHSSTAAVGAGIGTGLSFQVEDAGDIEEQGSIDVTLTDVTNDAEDADMHFNINVAGGMVEKLLLNADGLSLLSGGLEIQNGATFGTSALLIDNDDTDQIALEFEAANIDGDVIQVTADVLTTAYVMDVTADALTSGGILNLISDNNEATARTLVQITNDNPGATGATALGIQQDSTGNAITVTSGSDAAASALQITNSAGGFGVNVSRNLAAVNTDQALVYINDDGFSDQPALHIHTDTMDSAGGRALFIDADSMTTQQVVEITADALISGIGINLTSSSTNLTGAGRLLLVSSTGDFDAATGNVAEIRSIHTTGTGLLLTVDAVTDGFGAFMTADALTSGVGFEIESTSTGLIASGRLFKVDSTADFNNTGGYVAEFSGAFTTGRLVNIVNNVVTDGFLAHINSSSAVLDATGRMLLVSHTGTLTASGIIAEVASAATDETTIFRVTGSGALATGVALDVNVAAMTSGTAIDVSNLAAIVDGKALHIDATGTTQTTGILVHIDSASTNLTGAGRLLLVEATADFDAAAAIVAEVKSAHTTGIGFQVTTDSQTDGTSMLMTADALVDGIVLDINSTNIAITSGELLDIDWAPAAGTLTGKTGNLTSIAAITTHNNDSNVTLNFDTLDIERNHTRDTGGVDTNVTTNQGTVLRLINTVAETTGTVTDTVDVLSITQDADAGGQSIDIDHNANSVAILIDAENTTTNVIDISAAVLTSGTAIDLSDLDAIVDGKALHIDATGTTHTTGILVHIDSAADALTGAGRLLLVDHTPAAGGTTTGTIAEFQTSANDETILLQLTADSITTGTALDITIDAATQTTTKAINVDSTNANVNAGRVGSFVTANVSRTETGGAPISDDFDVMAITRATVHTGGTYTTASGSVLNLTNTTSGTIGTDDAYLLEATNTIDTQATFRDIVKLAATTTHGSHATAGFGLGITFHLENGIGTTEEHASMDIVTTDVTNGAEETDIVFRQMKAGAMAEGLRIDADGCVRLDARPLPLSDPFKYSEYMNPFMRYPDYDAANEWTFTDLNGATGSGALSDDVRHGYLVLDNGAITDNHGVQAQYTAANGGGEIVALTAGKRTYFEARVVLNAATEIDVFVGLAITDAALGDANGVMVNPANVSDFVGFRKDDGGTDWDLTCGTAAAASNETGLATADTSEVTLSFVCDGTTSIQAYIDGVAAGSALTTNIPTTEMCLSFAVINGDGTTQQNIHVLYVRVMQEY